MKKSIYLVSSSSGGHLYPARTLARLLSRSLKEYSLTLFTGMKPLDESVIPDTEPYRVRRLSGRTWRGPASLWSRGWLSEWRRTLWDIKRFFDEDRPALVIGFGGYLTVALVLEAKRRGIPTMIHEQNAVMGKANRFLYRWVDCVAWTFEPGPGSRSAKDVWTGYPVREDLKIMDRAEALGLLNLNTTKKTLLVTGGSQGSLFLNEAAVSWARRYGKRRSSQWQIVHVTGSTERRPLEDIYKNEGLECRILSYEPDVARLYSAADRVLSRAGSGALHEIAFFGKRSILVPYPGAGAHQLKNAACLAAAGLADCIVESDFTAELLDQMLEKAGAEVPRALCFEPPLRLDGAAKFKDEIQKIL